MKQYGSIDFTNYSEQRCEVEIGMPDGSVVKEASTANLDLYDVEVTLVENLMRGGTFSMKVWTSDWATNPETKEREPHVILAFYEIPGTSDNG